MPPMQSCCMLYNAAQGQLSASSGGLPALAEQRAHPPNQLGCSLGVLFHQSIE